MNRFLEDNYEVHESSTGGYYVKASFCTGKQGNSDAAVAVSMVPGTSISIFNREGFENKPNVLVQARCTANYEIKTGIVEDPFTGKETIIICPKPGGNGRSYRGDELTSFVKYAKARYVQEFGPQSAIPLLRVDVFLRQDGELVVNEFEHMEAQIDGSEAGLLIEFWKSQITHMLSK